MVDAAPAAPVNEVVIDPAPVNVPQPVGSQAPDKPVTEVDGSKHRPESRREAIQRAFERANNPPAKDAKPAPRPAAKPADAKPGHNNPPPEKQPDKDEPEGLDLKRRPSDQPRGERGQFAPRESQEQQSAANNSQARSAAGQQPGADQQRQVKRLPPTVPFHEPPSRMAERAKVDWADTPESVRGDVHRMQHEFGEAYKQYRGDHDTMNSIRQFQEMATSHGTTLNRALSNYVSMEQKLRSDVVGGLDVIVNNLNLRTPDGRKLNLRDIAYHVLNQSPEQHKLLQQQNAQAANSHQIGALHQEIAGLKNALNQMHTQQQYTYTRSAVDQFADAHPRFDELGELIQNELQFGFDLETAYRRAELLRPTTHAAQTRTTSAQTRPTDKSISGAPGVAPSNGASRKSEKKVGRREAIQNAISRVNGAL
jgi:hypothetical protein